MPCMRMSVHWRKAGTMRNPPPTPSIPVSNPEHDPMQHSVAVHREVQRRRPVDGSRTQFFSAAEITSAGRSPLAEALRTSCRSRRAAAKNMAAANSVMSTGWGRAWAIQTPTGEKQMPSDAISSAARHRTRPLRSPSKAPSAAEHPTANNATGVAACGSQPIPKTKAGTARMPPPAPVKPSTRPTAAP